MDELIASLTPLLPSDEIVYVGEQVSDIDSLRGSDRERKKQERKTESLLQIPDCADRERRDRLECDDIAWLRWYFGDGCGVEDPFTYKFTPQQIEMIHAIQHAITFGGDQAIAASRAEGKTTIAERLVLKAAITGRVSYTVLFASSGPLADNSIDTIRQSIAENERLAADYPEVCYPVQELENTPQRAHYQRASGNRHDNGQPYEMAELGYVWCGQEIIMPKVPGSPGAGSIIATRGLDAAVRGLKRRGKRPKLAIIDDPDSEDSSRSQEQAAKLERRIDGAIGGLGGQRSGIGRVMLTTLQSRVAVSYLYTDPKRKPTFKGRRYRFLLAKPQRADLWDEYVALRLDDLQQRDEHLVDLDPFGRRSHKFYTDRRAEMDAGAIVSNPNRFENMLLPDGTLKEESALQHYYNLIAKLGPEVVATEYDNDPPEESAVIESGLTPTRIQKQVSGYNRRKIPSGCVVLTQGMDVRKVAIHWVIRAWKPDGTGYVIDYGVHEVIGLTYGSDIGVDAAVTRAILSRMEACNETEYLTGDGERLPVKLTLCDAGWRTDAVYSACVQVGAGLMAVMGFGKSSGCTQASFRDQQHRTEDKKPGDGYFLSRRSRLWLVCADADRWKSWEHDRWMTAVEKPGCLYMFGQAHEMGDRMSDDQKGHHSYARHICNESEVDEPYRGVIRRVWKAKSDNTHWLDASYYCDVAARMMDIKIGSSMAAVSPAKRDPSQRMSLSAAAQPTRR